LTHALPRHVIPKKLKDGSVAYYYNVPTLYRRAGCPVSSEPLGTDYFVACGVNGEGGKAAALNGLFDEWNDSRRGLPIASEAAPAVGSVDWLFREYKKSKAYTEKVGKRSHKSYEWAMKAVCDTLNKRGVRIGNLPVKSITPLAADKLYDRFIVTPKGERLRRGEKLTTLCRKAWRVVQRLHPKEFAQDIPNPWPGVTMKTRVKLTKSAVSREQVYVFARGCIEHGEPECGAAAVICFEWLQRPENVIAGHIKWSGYRPPGKTTIQVEHHKTGAVIEHPLEERLDDGTVVKFYEDAEGILSHLKRRGIPIVLREIEHGKSKPFSFSGMQKIVQRMRKVIGLPAEFTLDACRHGGMTELEEAELTDGQGRALSAHRTRESYAGYAKRTAPRILSATRKRHAHWLANAAAETALTIPEPLIERERASVEKGIVYFIRQGALVKIGFTTNLARRMKELTTTSAHNLTVIKTVPGTMELEAFFHDRFKALHHRNEWFRHRGDLVAFLQDKGSTDIQNTQDFDHSECGENEDEKSKIAK
jgi:hypothetical protein